MVEETSRRRPMEVDMEEDEQDLKRLKGPGGDVALSGKQLVQLISKIDENPSGTLEESLEEVANTLEKNLDPYEGQIIDVLMDCAKYLPEKLTIFTTLIGILNAKSSQFGYNMIEKLISDLNQTFVEADYDISIRLATFIADLGNARVLSIDAIFLFLESFVDLAVEENRRSDYFIYTVLHTLPWIGAELNEKKPEEFRDLLKRIRLYLDSRQKLFVKMISVWASQVPHKQEDYLDSLWAQIQQLEKDKWLEHHIIRVYIHFEPIFSNATQHNIPSINFDEIKSNKKLPTPKVVFRLFDFTDCPENENVLPSVISIERFLIEEDLNWIIDNNYTDWRLCAKTLLNYHRRDVIPLNYSIIEVIFGQLFRLPNSSYLSLFYGALLIELCRIRAETMPQVLAQAAELLYQRSDTMQPVCLDRFVDWFTYHLSNFQYRWSWSDWADCLELDTLHPRLIFVREVIEKCIRLSYHKKVVEFLPDEFHAIMPPEPVLIYLLDESNHPAHELAQTIKALIVGKRSEEEILAALKQNSSLEDEPAFDSDSVAIFFTVLLRLASKTISHNFAALTKYHKILRTVVEESEEKALMQPVLLRTLYDCWNRNKQIMTILVDKLLKMQIVDPAVVQAWIFCDEMKREFKRSWVWDILNTAIRRLEYQYAKVENLWKENPEANQETLKEVDEKLRSVLLNICHKFTLILTEHLINCETDGTEVETDFYNYVIGRFRSIFLSHAESMAKYSEDLERELFSDKIEPRILEIFKQFRALKN